MLTLSSTLKRVPRPISAGWARVRPPAGERQPCGVADLTVRPLSQGTSVIGKGGPWGLPGTMNYGSGHLGGRP
jgi:hypothetical protein